MIAKAPQRENFYFSLYINKCKHEDLFKALEFSTSTVVDLFSAIPEDKHNFAYADGKWTVKEVLSHLIDTERVLCYRALCFSRKETTGLPGYDENQYVANDDVSSVAMVQLLEEYKTVRRSTIQFYNRITESGIDFEGNANGSAITARELGWTIAGHDLHHCEVLIERYL